MPRTCHTDRLFGLFVAQDFNDPTHNIAYLLQGGLGMPDREYYLADNARMADIRAKYRAHIAAVLSLPASVPDAAPKAERILDLETKIARAHWSREDSGDVHKANTVWARADFDSERAGSRLGGLLQGRRPRRPAGVHRLAGLGAIAGEAALRLRSQSTRGRTILPTRRSTIGRAC